MEQIYDELMQLSKYERKQRLLEIINEKGWDIMKTFLLTNFKEELEELNQELLAESERKLYEMESLFQNQEFLDNMDKFIDNMSQDEKDQLLVDFKRVFNKTSIPLSAQKIISKLEQ